MPVVVSTYLLPTDATSNCWSIPVLLTKAMEDEQRGLIWTATANNELDILFTDLLSDIEEEFEEACRGFRSGRAVEF